MTPERRRCPECSKVEREIFAETADAPGLVTCNYGFSRGPGLPIPSTWDPRALFDDKGRRVS